MAQNIERELQEQISKPPNEQQRRVLDFARSLAALPQSNGGSGEALLRYAGTIEQDDLAIIEEVIDEDCEMI
jgi:hypothetical protein